MIDVEKATRIVLWRIEDLEKARPGTEKYERRLAKMIVATTSLIHAERIAALDELERAALSEETIGRLFDEITVQDVRARLELMRPGAGIEVSR